MRVPFQRLEKSQIVYYQSFCSDAALKEIYLVLSAGS